mgnify:CR=1 FL=1
MCVCVCALTLLAPSAPQVTMKDARAREQEFFKGKPEYQDLQVRGGVGGGVCV